MKIKFLFGLFLMSLCACSITSNAPYGNTSSTYRSKYFDQLDEGSKLLRSWYHYTVEQTKDEQVILKIYYPDTKQMTHYLSYSSSSLKERNGKHIEWTDKGLKWVEGQFEHNQRTGEWKFYNWRDGTLSNYGPMKNGKRNGNWTTLYNSGSKFSERTFEDGILNGPYTYYDKAGKVKKQGSYLNGEDQNPSPTDGMLENAAYKIVEEFPCMASCENEDYDQQKKCSDRTMLEAVYKNIKYPSRARQLNVAGSAVVSFIIEKDGSMNEITPIRGVCKEIEAEVIRVVKELPKWNPGRQRGKPVRVEFKLPVRFRLV